MDLLETQNSFCHCGTCHIHSEDDAPGKENKNSNKRKANVEEEDGTSKSRPKEAMPSFSSPWGASSCSPKKVLWKEVEDYNRQRKRVRLLGWAGLENPWETETSSTVCSGGSDCSDADECVGRSKQPDGENENQTVGKGGGIEEGGIGEIEGIKVVITTSKDGTTTTILSAEPHKTPRNGVEIVTKTVIRGNEVMTLTTTTLIPLALKTESAD
jgi:hypothetical protein